ncbi:NUDIX domain-containing protein [Embleya sp. NPDC056575]|uniref:NUDIX hydrolase n=1 Tax=unclassified Embleya TaxID=2699296 RepID=UPI003696864B
MDDPPGAAEPAHDPILAAGGVLWRRTPDGTQVGLVHRPRYDDWSFPKGKLEPGEPAVVAAVREIAEETGFRAVLGRELGVRSYPMRSRDRIKINRYWVAEAVSGDFTPNHEVDRMWWGAPEEAAERSGTPDYTASLTEAFRTGPPPATVPVVVLRAGPAFAPALVPMLAAFAPVEVYGCAEPDAAATVAPYVAAAGARVHTAAVSPAEAVRAGRPALLCTPVPDPPAIASEAGSPRLPAEPLLPGEFAVLHTWAGRVVAVGRYAPYPTGS